MELGIYSFADVTEDPVTGRTISAAQRLRDLVEEIELADDVGLDVYGLGEHHRPDYASSAPAVVLAAAASRTRRIRLTSAVTVLSSDDPVRVWQQFATLDDLSAGRAEIMVGRGSFIESFPLFGYDLSDYDTLFEEKLDLLLRLREGGPVSWSGRHRAPMEGQSVYPEPEQERLPIWLAVGGTPESAVRAGHDPAAVPLSVNAHGWIADTMQDALAESFPYHAVTMNRIGRERGWPPLTPERYAAGATRRGALVAGSPREVADKILYQHELFGHERFLLQVSVGTMPHERVLRAIERFGREVAPVVREGVARRKASAASG